jgi:hypothetical protein
MLEGSHLRFPYSGQIWHFTILLFFLSNLKVISVENTHKTLYTFSSLVNTCTLVNSFSVDYPTQPQTWLYSNSDFWSLWSLVTSSFFRWRVTMGLWFIQLNMHNLFFLVFYKQAQHKRALVTQALVSHLVTLYMCGRQVCH